MNAKHLSQRHKSSKINVKAKIGDSEPLLGLGMAISQNGILLGTSFVQGGLAWVDYPSISTINPLLITVTAFNRVPYQGEVLILNPENAYLILNAHQLNEISGN